jgi:mono/diheme cytochrome c family protein
VLCAALTGRLAAETEPNGADPDNPVLVESGKALYAQHCSACHGANLEGQPNWRKPLPNGHWPAPPHDRTGHTWHHPDKTLFDITKYGMQAMVADRESDMPAFKDVLADADIWAALSLIESTWPADIRERQRQISRKQR